MCKLLRQHILRPEFLFLFKHFNPVWSMLKHFFFLIALSLTTAACTQETALPQLVEAPLPDTATLQVDYAFVTADNWYFSGETDAIYLLRGDSLFASPVKPLRWQWLGADPAWRGRTIFRVYKAGKGIAVLFTYMEPETETGKVPLLWFSGQQTVAFSPAPPRPGHRWQLIPEPVLPGNKGLFLYLHQDSIDWETRNRSFDSTAIYWLSLTGRALTRLPFRQKPEYYDTSMRFAFFATGHRLYPEENQFHPTFHRFDTQSGKIDPGVPDLRLKEPWCMFHGDPWDERSCLIERWGLRKDLQLDAQVEGIRIPNGQFIRLEWPQIKIRPSLSQDSLWANAGIWQYSDAGENLVFSTVAPHRLFVVSKKEGARAKLLEESSYLYRFGAFPNGNSYAYSKTKDDLAIPFENGSLFLYDRAGNTRMDIFKHLRRPATNPDYQNRETFQFHTIDVAGFLPAAVRLCYIRQGFLPKFPEPKDGSATEIWNVMFSASSTAPFPRELVNRQAFLHEDGRLTLVDLSFLGKHESDFQSLLFHPSGAILARDWRSDNLKWWGFEVP